MNETYVKMLDARAMSHPVTNHLYTFTNKKRNRKRDRAFGSRAKT